MTTQAQKIEIPRLEALADYLEMLRQTSIKRTQKDEDTFVAGWLMGMYAANRKKLSQ